MLIDEARRKLIEAQSLPEVKIIRDKTDALIKYFRQQKDVSAETVLAAQDLCQRAGRRMGKMLSTMEKNEGGRPTNPSHKTRGSTPTLKELGLTYDQSAKLQKAAELSDEEFEQLIAAEKAKGENGDITAAKVYRAAKAKEPKPEPVPPPAGRVPRHHTRRPRTQGAGGASHGGNAG